MMGKLFVRFYRFYLRLSCRLFSIASRGAFYRLGKGSSIRPPIRMVGVDRVEIGDDVYIGAGSWLAVRSESGKDPVITIGDSCAFSGYITIAAVKRIIIESKVLIARYVYISDHSHKYHDSEVAILDQGITEARMVHIKTGAWIGQSVVIMPGVTIGRNAVVGANSIVRDDVPDNAVAVGAPARVVRIDKTKER